MELELLHPPSSGSVVWFSLICSRVGGLDSGSIDTWYRCRREQEEGGRRCDKVPGSSLWQRREDLLLWRHLEYDFLVFVPCFLPFIFFPLFLILSCIPIRLSSPCSFVCGAAICYSQQVRTLDYSTCSFCLCHLYPTSSPNYFIFYS